MQKKKSQNLKTREYSYNPDMSEWTTRKRYIDADLKAMVMCLTKLPNVTVSKKSTRLPECQMQQERDMLIM